MEEIEAHAGAHEEHRDQEPGQECHHDRGQPEVLGYHREGQGERDGEPGPQRP
jgi:hypothetical protein